ncbi:arginine-glutamic acid dipeptide repeats -like isoform X1, partial [Brachionus plicatilis]
MDVLALRMTATANASSNPSPADFGCQNDVNNRTLANTTNFNHDESKNVLSLKNPIQNNDKPEKMDTVVPYSSRPLTFSTYRSYNGRARPSNNIQFKEENIPSYTDANGVVYRVSDHVYMDINKPNQPFAIAYILDFKLTKRDLVMIEVRWYYRPNEIPDGVYMPLMQDRLSENKNVANELIVLEPIIKGRELFASECKDIYPSSFIKGKCRVIHYQDILEAKHFKPFADTFFCILTYNPEARRLANTQGEIRVGPSHQAKLPPCVADPSAEQPADESDKWETCTWRYKSISDANLLTYLQAARSIAAFAGMCDRGNADDMYDAAQSDSTTIYAIDVLHDMQYDTSKALQYLVKNPMSAKAMDKKWTDDDQKKFVKGLRQYGKNFLRIRKELLAHKDTPDLVEFYYLWKKTPQAVNGRPRRRFTRPVSSNKRAANTSNANNSKKPNEQFSGGSEVDSDNNESDESSEQKTITNNANQCTNCFTTSSKDLQNGGRDNRLLCYDCRMYYKKYGELPKIASGVGCDAKKSKEMAKTLANNGVRSEESTDVKSEEVETNESTSAGNESDYQDYDQDVTDTNIEMNEDENGPRAEKRAKDPAQSNTTMNSDVNMKEC